MLIPAEQIAKRFLILGVTLISVYPRMPSDSPGWSVGGNLSRNFRKLLLFVVAINISRIFLSGEQDYHPDLGFFSDFLGVIEVSCLAFLCYLTPYILETRLTKYIHLKPGAGFYGPLLTSTVLGFLGLLLSRTVDPRWYSLKKLAQAISGPPVISSLRCFNEVSTARTDHRHGFMIGQATMALEHWHIFVQIACFLGYALNRNHDSSDQDTAYDILLEAARSTAFLADWTRVLMHALFLNMIDELNHFHVFDTQFVDLPETGSLISKPGVRGSPLTIGI